MAYPSCVSSESSAGLSTTFRRVSLSSLDWRCGFGSGTFERPLPNLEIVSPFSGTHDVPHQQSKSLTRPFDLSSWPSSPEFLLPGLGPLMRSFGKDGSLGAWPGLADFSSYHWKTFTKDVYVFIYLYDTWYINVSYIFFQNLIDVILRCHDPLIKSLDLWAHEPCTYQENLAPKAGPATWHRNSIVKGRLKCPFILVRDSSDSSFICCLCEMTPEMNKQWASLWSFAQLIFPLLLSCMPLGGESM